MASFPVVYDGYLRIEKRLKGTREHEVLATPFDAVGILIHCPERNQVLLVEQVRPAMINEDNPTGRIVEIVAGQYESWRSYLVTAAKEVEEEVGIKIDSFRFVPMHIVTDSEGILAFSPGKSTEKVILLYLRVTAQEVEAIEGKTFGLKEEGEETKPIWVNIDRLLKETYLFADLKTFAACMWLLWKLGKERLSKGANTSAT
jgi:ADP-ribose pyrophosphatase